MTTKHQPATPLPTDSELFNMIHKADTGDQWAEICLIEDLKAKTIAKAISWIEKSSPTIHYWRNLHTTERHPDCLADGCQNKLGNHAACHDVCERIDMSAQAHYLAATGKQTVESVPEEIQRRANAYPRLVEALKRSASWLSSYPGHGADKRWIENNDLLRELGELE